MGAVDDSVRFFKKDDYGLLLLPENCMQVVHWVERRVSWVFEINGSHSNCVCTTNDLNEVARNSESEDLGPGEIQPVGAMNEIPSEQDKGDTRNSTNSSIAKRPASASTEGKPPRKLSKANETGALE